MCHEGLRLGLPEFSPEQLITSRGSVGFDRAPTRGRPPRHFSPGRGAGPCTNYGSSLYTCSSRPGIDARFVNGDSFVAFTIVR